MASLLITKLHVPRPRTDFVARPRLIARLEEGLSKKLTLISAPAGYGKTTLLSEWLAAAAKPAAWVALDKGDNDPARFWAYVTAALQRALASTGRSLPETPPGEAFLTDLINVLDGLQQPLILVLDDYHTIETQAIHDGLAYLLEFAPAHFHLVLSTRGDPPLPLAKLRARSELLEIRQVDLCFTAQETFGFLNHTMDLHVSDEDAARITGRTEGWIAGLQMAALSMRGTEDPSRFIDLLSGSHHYIFDYLMDEILNSQPPETRRFLLYTSILGQLTAPLCDALLQPEAEPGAPRSSAVILEELDRANLFIRALDQERRWYRYHTLFAEVLRSHLQRSDPSQITALHARASMWFEAQGAVPEAIRHALAAGEWERASRLIGANVFALLEQNELSTVASQLDALTGVQASASPWLWIGRAWLAAYTGQMSAVESILSMAEEQMNDPANAVDRQTLRGHCAAIRAFTAWIGGGQTTTRAALEALEWLPPADSMIRCLAATVLGLSTGDMEKRGAAFAQALVYARESGVSHVALFAYGCRAYWMIMSGKLHEAHAACHEAIWLAQSHSPHQPLPALSHTLSTLSIVLWEWNDLEGALRYARDGVVLAKRWEQADALHFAYTVLGDVLFAAGDTQGAFDILRQAWQLAHRTSVWFEEITIAQEVEWHLAQNNLDAALERLRLAGVDTEHPSQAALSALILQALELLYLAQKQYPRALAVITANLKNTENQKVVYFMVRAQMRQALAHYGMGQNTQTLAALKKALALAAPEGYIRSLISAGPGAGPLLRQARAAGIQPEYIDRLLAALEPARQAAAPADSPLAEPLSEREMDVLRLLAQGFSDKEIAAKLVIATGTVHKHLNNIYGKLEAHSRTTAIVRAREMEIL